MLISISDRLSRSARARHLLFLIATVLTLLVVGYHYGTFDQNIHLPFLKKFADGALYPTEDAFFNMRFQHYSFFWFIFLPFYRLGVLEWTLFLAHVAATYLTFWAFWSLTQTVFHDALAGLMAVTALIIPHIGFSSFPIFEWSLLNRTAMLPFVLWAINLFLQRRYVRAFTLLGVVFNFHVLSASYALALFGLAGLVEFKKIGWRTAALSLAAFALTAAPLLVWRALSPPLRLAPDPDWFAIVSNGMFYHLFYLIGPYAHIWLVTLGGLSALALFIIAVRARLAPPHDRVVIAFIGAVLLIILAQTASTYLWPITLIAQSQMMRAGLLALILSYVYFAGYLAAQYRSGAWRGWDLAGVWAAYATGIFALLPVLAWAIVRGVRSAVWRKLALAVSIGGMFLVTLGVAFTYELWSPGVYVYMRSTPWHEAQAWARDHTPRDAVFITPLHEWWLFTADWRVFSERAQVASLSDLLEIALVPDYLPAWEARFETLAPGALAQFKGDFFANRQITARAYASLSDEALLRAAETYGADYIVIEKPGARPWPVAYENSGFIIYTVPPR